MPAARYRWKIRRDWDRVPDLATGSRLLDLVLSNRGLTRPEEAQAFLNPDPPINHDPFLFKEMQAAVDRILAAVDRGEKVLVYGDYDVDGVTGTAVIVDFLRQLLDDKVFYYIPDRIDEGYGVHLDAVKKAAKNNFGLIITNDCGITAHEAAEWLKGRGVDMVITDHHEPQGVLPNAVAVLNPKVPGSGYPFAELSGSGVALKLVQGLAAATGRDSSDIWSEYAPLAGLGAIADEVPLLDENISLARQAVNRLALMDRPGIVALREVWGLKDRDKLTVRDISFRIAPRINAVGRLGNSRRGVQLLLARDQRMANLIAREMDEHNQKRRTEQDRIRDQVFSRLESDPAADEPVIVLAGEDWHPGVIGIVASHVAERYARPAILLTAKFTKKPGEESLLKGSGRSWGEFNLFEALQSCSGRLERFGGHQAAGGLTLRGEALDAFRREVCACFDKAMQDRDTTPLLDIEATLPPQAIRLDHIVRLAELEPFGAGNPEPVFAIGPAVLESVRWVGKDGLHLKASIRYGDSALDAIGFSFDRDSVPAPGRPVMLAGRLGVNTWMGRDTVQLQIQQIKSSDAE